MQNNPAPEGTFFEKFVQVQKETKVTKDNRNDFGKYNYRKAEDILAEAKPICAKLGLFILLSDKVEMVGERYYIVAEAKITDGKDSVSSVAWAREDDKQAGMAAPQVTGSSSSYARKYALSGLLGLDDEKDADDTNDHGKKQEQKPVDKDVKTSGGSQMTGPKEWGHVKELAAKKGVKAGFIKFIEDYHKEVARLERLPDA